MSQVHLGFVSGLRFNLPKKLSAKKSRSQNCAPKKSWSKKCCVKKDVGPEKKVGPKRCLIQKVVGPKKSWVQKKVE